MNGKRFTRSGTLVARLLMVLVGGALVVAACGGGETASGTTSPTASPSPAASNSETTSGTLASAASTSPAVWASPRPAVSYSRAGLLSTRTSSGLTPSTTPRVSSAGTIGWEFTPTIDIKVSELGCFDAGRDGLARAHRVGIFDAGTKRLLASVTVRSKSTLDGFFRWESLGTPLVLQAQRSYVVGTEDRQTLETLYTRHSSPEQESYYPPPGEHWATEVGFPVLALPGHLLVSRSSQGAFTAPTVPQDLWGGRPWFSPNFKFKPAGLAPIVMSDGAFRLDVPGKATLARTQAVAHRYARALSTEKIPGAGLYAEDATWGGGAMGRQVLRGAMDIQRMYRENAAEADEEPGWAFAKRSKHYHLLVAPGVAMLEGMSQFSNSVDSGPYLALLAVNGDRIAHEEVWDGVGEPVACCGASPGSGDTAQVAAEVGAALGEALATRDRAALQALLAGDVLFRDATDQRNVRGPDAVYSWWATLAPAEAVKIENLAPIAGPGWAVVRWKARRSFKDEWAFPDRVIYQSRNGATVIEVRDGKVVRVTLYVDSEEPEGSILQPE